jgi:sec-independent protein translocase protein TatB
MFDIGWGELLVIGVVALIVIGPKELPGVLRALGQWMAKIRRMASEFQSQFQEAMREAEMADLKKEVDELHHTARNMTSNFDPLGYMGVKESTFTDMSGKSSADATDTSQPSAAPPDQAAGTSAGAASASEPVAAPPGVESRPPAPATGPDSQAPAAGADSPAPVEREALAPVAGKEGGRTG